MGQLPWIKYFAKRVAILMAKLSISKQHIQKSIDFLTQNYVFADHNRHLNVRFQGACETILRTILSNFRAPPEPAPCAKFGSHPKVARATFGCPRIHPKVAQATFGCPSGHPKVARATFGWIQGHPNVARATFGWNPNLAHGAGSGGARMWQFWDQI